MTRRILRAIGLSASLLAAAILGDGTLAPASAQSPAPTIPLCTGLTIVTAVDKPQGDYESIKTLVDAGDREIQLAYSAQVPTGTGGFRHYDVKRTILRTDLSTANLYMHYFSTRGPATIPGSTALGTSTAVLRALKTKGAAELRIVAASNSAYSADPKQEPNVYQFAEIYKLRRVGNGSVPVRLVVNDAVVTLPAVQAQGDSLGDKAEFFFLDDERNPLALAYRFDTGGGEGSESGGLRVVKISYRCSGPTASPSTERIERLERALREQRRAVVYDLYFDFNSDAIREESQPTLRDIAEVLKRNPDWKLSIEGHTDAVASDSYNLSLSQRRAAAVKTELTTHFGIAAARLTSAGFGESRPQDRNDTIEGRARNRRVELVRP